MNANDRKQIQIREHQAARREDQRKADLKTIVDMSEGRRFLNWFFSQLAPPKDQIWNPNAAIAGFNAARVDVSNWLKAQIEEVDPDALVLMIMEARALERQEQAERDALDRRRSRTSESDNENESGNEGESIDG